MKKNRERSIGKLLYFTEQELEIIQNNVELFCLLSGNAAYRQSQAL